MSKQVRTVGVDFGTMNIAKVDDSGVDIRRNVFLTLPKQVANKKQLKRMNIPFVEIEDEVYLLSKNAYEFANIFNTSELQRPMSSGLLNPKEQAALPIIKYITEDMIGKAQSPEDIVVYSVPGQTIDQERSVEYHRDVLGEILDDLGYKSMPLNEAVAVSYVGLKDNMHTGISISAGSGQINVAIMYQGLSSLQFSVAKAGDWVSQNIAADCNISIAKATYIKERGDYSISPNSKEKRTREQQAAKTYYESLIIYVLRNIAAQFNASENTPAFPNEVPICISGGTAAVDGFIDLFKDVFTTVDFPIDVGDIFLIDEPLLGTARGCYEHAKIEVEDD